MKVNQLDPRHKPLLEDHWSGFIWVRPLRRALKYRGRLVFTPDLAESIRKSLANKVNGRRRVPWLAQHNRDKWGYVFSNVDFIKVYECTDPSVEDVERAQGLWRDLISQLRRDARLAGLKGRYCDGYAKVSRVNSRPGSRGPLTVWLWKFENKSLGLKFPHIYHHSDVELEQVTYERGKSVLTALKSHRVRVGKSRREFAEFYNLSYACLQQLAAGRIKSHRGWTLIGEPEKVTKSKADIMKDEMEYKKSG